MPIFRTKLIEVEAIQWNGDNGQQLINAFGPHLAAFPSNPDGSLNVTTTEGATFVLRVGDWMFLDILQELEIVKKVKFYKQYDYVSG
jgi:hypothetical protein